VTRHQAAAVVATYTYDTWGNLTGATEIISNANGWTNPYRFDGRDGVRSDAATGLDWMATRAYDPTTGRFIARDPLGRAPPHEPRSVALERSCGQFALEPAELIQAVYVACTAHNADSTGATMPLPLLDEQFSPHAAPLQ
jgi:RHS repeat-associated protein